MTEHSRLNWQLRDIAEKCLQSQIKCEQVADERQCIFDAMREAIKLALTMDPSDAEIECIDYDFAGDIFGIRRASALRAMNEARLKEWGMS